ncbi:protein YIPF3-like isoform X2 [Mizuhopecten yessoensis]|uniref:Protein YIPF3 n=1 Tax=Mizuhopecten yessoensis TaxID=6573 RepID=A0A210QP79_MIZYE|nr:protein YIPF3-like isoform X2 [Mizuhopecten yessoensis]OWF50544.1 Protein YIPF3 [Mizuhopecten yessoensis]
MADTLGDRRNQQGAASQSAVIDLNDVEEMPDRDDSSDYDSSFSDSDRGKKKGMGDDIRQRLGENVAAMMWQSGKQQASKAWNLYGNIDILRPYFNVEPREVRSRLMWSFIPQKPTSQRQRVSRELYGPLMVIFTMIALLLFQMKTADHRVEEGTLMGTAFGVCFTYWFGASAFIWFLSFVCNTRLSMLQIMSMLGYGLFGHCMVILLGTVIHTSHDHVFFYLLWAVIGGATTLKMVGIIVTRTSGQTQRIIVCAAVAALHLLFLLYLHFAYHQIVEDLSQAFGSGGVQAQMKEVPVAIKPGVGGLEKAVKAAI